MLHFVDQDIEAQNIISYSRLYNYLVTEQGLQLDFYLFVIHFFCNSLEIGDRKRQIFPRKLSPNVSKLLSSVQ